MEKIALIADASNIAVWYATIKHADLLSVHFPVEIYLRPGYDDRFVPQRYKTNIRHWSSPVNLYKQIKTSENICWIWHATALSVVRHWRLRIWAHKKNIFWVQGLVADESFMRNGSRLRRFVLRIIENLSFRMSDCLVFVSQAMKRFYEAKGIRKTSVVIPCLCDAPQNVVAVKRIPNSFVYIGGLSPWQCFDEMLQMYNSFRSSDSVLHIITFDITTALDKVRQRFGDDTHDISVYSVTDREQIPEVLSQFQFGFLLRKTSPVNEVASPIKFLEYISNGVNVIMTDAVKDYAEIVRKYKIGTIVTIGENDVVLNEYNPDAITVYNRQFSFSNYKDTYLNLIN